MLRILTVNDIPFRKILGLNQQTYQRLKLALSLHLRRQVFVAVCDDLVLRDRIANQLITDLAFPPSLASTEQPKANNLSKRYPRFVSLQLNLSDPNPIAQIVQWITQNSPPRKGNRRAAIPTFQFVGIERLTRQPAAVQRLFFAHLQSIERNLTILESGLLIWMPQPWFNALSQSAPEFWHCRTGTFEFIGDPTPVAANDTDIRLQPRRPSAAKPSRGSESRNAEASPIPLAESETPLAQEELWNIIARDLAYLDEQDETRPRSQPDAPPSDAAAKLQSANSSTVTLKVADKVIAKVADKVADKITVTSSPILVKPKSIVQSQQSQIHTEPSEAPQPASRHVDKQHEKATTTLSTNSNLPAAPQANVSPSPNAKSFDLQSLPLLRQIEMLHQQQAPPTELAEAYQILGNLYRDRIEQGDSSLQNLEIAINAYEQVLVWLHETSPLWIDVLNDLGNLYWMLSRYHANPEATLKTLQQSIQAYQLALNKLDLQTQAHAYPMLQNNLGSAYADLARYQNPVENLQRSIQAYQQTLHYRKPDTEPLRYASTQNNLGTTYWSLAQYQQPEVYLKQAIAAYSEALKYYNPEQDPLSYAMIQNNLGTAYWNLSQHERPQDWLRLALGAYQTALKYRTLEAAPTAFAATQNNLGTAFWHLANHAKENPEQRLTYLQQAINAYEAALIASEHLAQRPQTTPLNFDLFATHNNLALAHYQIATDPRIAIETSDHSIHLEVALENHLKALEGWQSKPELRQTAFSCVLQTIRALYNQCGLAGQNLALSKVPGHLLPELLAQL